MALLQNGFLCTNPSCTRPDEPLTEENAVLDPLYAAAHCDTLLWCSDDQVRPHVMHKECAGNGVMVTVEVVHALRMHHYTDCLGRLDITV